MLTTPFISVTNLFRSGSTLFALFGPSVEILRLFTIFLGLVTLLFFYLFAREVFGPWTAFWGLLLLSLDSSFLFYSKLDAGPIVEQLMWMMIGLWSFARWGRMRKHVFLLLGLVSGIFGIHSHVAFIWVLSAGWITALLFYRRELAALLRRPSVYVVAPSIVLILAIFLYWLTIESAKLSEVSPGLSGAFVMLERLSILGGILPDVLLGKYSELALIFQTRPLTDIFIVASILFLLSSGKVRTREIRALFLIAFAIFLQISWTPGDFVIFPHRMMYVYLFLILFSGLAVARSVAQLWHVRETRCVVKVISVGVVLLAVTSVCGQVALKREADERIRRTGGRGLWSDTTYALAAFVAREDLEKVMCVDDTLYPLLSFLTKGQIHVVQPSYQFYAGGRATRHRLLSQIILRSSPRTLFVLFRKNVPLGDTLERDFKEIVQTLDVTANLEKAFHDKEGDLLYLAYTVRKK